MAMTRWRPALCFLLILAGQHVMADVKGRVRASLESGEVNWVGQQITLNLDVMTTGYRFFDIRFNLPEVAGAFLVQADSTTIKLNETLNGEAWQIIRYPLVLYPQKAGFIHVPPIKVRFGTADSYGGETRDYALQTQTLTLDTQLPPGVSPGSPVVSTGEFETRYDWLPPAGTEDPVAARVGDAISLTVTQTAQGISGMLLRPLPVFQSAGLRAYPESPDIRDRVDRGSLTGERTDAVTWIVEQPGSYAWPEIRFQWWDPENRQLKERLVPGLLLEATALPAAAGEAVSAGRSAGAIGRTWLLVAAVTVLVVLLAGLLADPVKSRLSRRSTHRRDSEAADFRALVDACSRGDPQAAYHAASAWLHRVAPQCTSLSEFAGSARSEKLRSYVLDLQNALVADESAAWNGAGLSKQLGEARRELLQKQKRVKSVRLPALNPG